MNVLYTLGIQFYAFIIGLAASFSVKAKDWKHGRKTLFASLPTVNSKEVYWFHCASLGEFDQGLPLMNLLRGQKPDAFILVTFFSPSGLNHFYKRQHPADFVCYIPIDTPKNAKKFVQHFQPKATFFVKYEFWINHINALKTSGSKLYSISTALRSNQHFFKFYGGFFRNALRQFDYFFAQNQKTVDLLHSIDIQNVVLTGDTRFDRVIENKLALHVNEKIHQFVMESNNVLIAGSTWPKDIELLKKTIESDLFDTVIIAPHNVDKASVDVLQKSLEKPTVRLSEWTSSRSERVLIVDSIGQLASAYSLGTIAYVGGGFSGSLHNILEPAVFGLPVLFGPKHSRFPEAETFLQHGIGFSVSTPEELHKSILFIRKNQSEIAQKSIQLVEENKGAASTIIAQILQSYPPLDR